MTNKICLVCGDKAVAKNFDVWSCKSCKPFFRRNALIRDELYCNLEGNCEITVSSRKGCRKCRLEKCFAVGMKKEWILNEEQRSRRMRIIAENRQKRRIEGIIDVRPESTQSLDSYDSWTESQEFDSLTESQELDSLSELSTDLSEDVISDVEELISINQIIENSYKNYKISMDLSLPLIRSVYNPDKSFNQLEEYKLTELFQLLQQMKFYIKKGNKCIDVKVIQEVVHHGALFYEYEAERLIRTIKKLNSFQSINENDKLALVKYSSLEILVLRSVSFYDPQNESWTMPINQDQTSIVRMDILRQITTEGYAAYKNNWNCIVKECDSDSVVIDLLTAIGLFNPNRPNIIDRDSIEDQQRVYMHLLKRYLLFKCRSKSESEEKFCRLINILIFSNILAQLERKYFVLNYPQFYGPIARELFDCN